MSKEDMQRTIEFILDQQAQFATNIQLLRETQTQLTISQAKDEVRTDRIEELVLKTVAVVERIADALDRTDGLVAAVAAAQAHTEASLSRLAERTEVSLRELAASQVQTEASLSGLAERTEVSLRELAASQVQTEASLREVSTAQARAAGGQETTDERLKTLINVVERYISKGTEGDSE